MYSLRRKIIQWFVLVMLLAVAGNSQAQTGTTTVLKNTLDGSRQQLAKDSAVTVQDSIYFNPNLINKLDTPYQVRNVITFKINEYSGSYLPRQFNATVRARIIYTKPNFSVDSVEKDFIINYDIAGTYTNRSSFVFNNAHKVTVKVISVSGVTANVMKALQLENEMNVRPVYKISCTDDAVKSISSASVAGDDSVDELPVVWPVVTGIDAYDLEWAYVDSSAYNSNKYGNPLDPQLLFRNNASRVTVRTNTYNIPLLYDNGGILFFRVRGVQEKAKGNRVETAWSSDYSGGLGRFSFAGHQLKLNWKAAVGYAEEGKRKAVVEYYDGSLRNRQSVTKDNTTNKTIVQETYYDYQGRPAVEVMPVPTLNSVIKYSAKFNGGMNGLEYDKSNYDRLTSPAAYLTTTASPMIQSLGASQYYSRGNPDKTGTNQFIPLADNFPFVETAYTQDNTGRISRQSGVGYTYRLGSNHETKYYYGTPGENDLDVLFGTEAGDRSHYFKNMVQDANGQYAVTYLDMYGRTVALALAGTPDSASLDNLSSNTSFSVTDTLSRANSNLIKDLVMESSQSQLVTIDGDYQFKYKLTPPVLQKKDCNNNTVCYNGLYELEIKITDDAYNQRLGGKAFDTIIRNYTGTIIANCNAPQSFDVAFTKRLPRGNYEITKRLTIRRDAMDYYRDSVFMKKNLCTTLEQFVQQQRDLLVNTQCTPDCASCQEALGSWESFRVKYMTAAGIRNADTASYRGEAWAAYGEASAACDVLCNKVNEVTDIRTAMLTDISAPSGQYADPDDTLNIYSIFYQKDETVLPAYKDEALVYLDEAGKPDQVYDESSNSYVIPQRLRPDQFASKFKTSWAAALLKYHPEYCKLLEFEKHEASYMWDREFERTETYLEAKAKGYLNPTGTNSTFPATASGKDPLAAESSDLTRQLDAKLNNFNGGSGANILSLWSVATVSVKCPDNSSSCIATYNTPAKAFNESTMCTGDLNMAWSNFRQLYLSVKQGILSDRIKNASCPSGIQNPTAAQLIAAGKQLNFNNAKDALTQNGLDYVNNNPDAGQISGSTNAALQQLYTDNCNAYAKAWVQQLAPCKYSQTVLNNIIIPRLVQVCKEGSDGSHPMGSSSVKPGSTNTYRSFQEVIDQYNAQNGINNPTDCNGYMITNPAPYDKQVAYTNKPIYTKPEPCECEKLNKYYEEYRKTGDLYSSFSSYLEQVRQIKMSGADLNQLLESCNESITCTYFEKVINIPPALQCNIAETCVTCAVVETNYQAFLKAYPGITPLKEEVDTFQQKKNRLFANYMNNKLGFSKQAWEYLHFRDSCPNTPPPAANPAVCAQLEWAKNQFLTRFGSTEDSLDIQKTIVGDIVTHVISTDNKTAYAAVQTSGAAVWKDSSNRMFILRDNLKFHWKDVMPDNARIIYASLVLTGKQTGTSWDLFKEIKSHYSTNGTAFGYIERALGPVIPGVTTFSTLPAVTTSNRISLQALPAGSSNGNPGAECTKLITDLYNEYQKGMDYGLMMRMDDATEAGNSNNAYVFTYNAVPANNTAGPWLSVQYRVSRCDEWEIMFNFWNPLGTPGRYYTTAQIDSMFVVNCGVPSGFCGGSSNPNPDPDPDDDPSDGPLLCGNLNPVFAPVDVNEINNCSDNEFFSVSKGTELFKAYRDSLLGSFNQDYINTGLQAANKEIFTVTYNTSEYHYTLFYYDQAGNLVKTVPPAGVVIDRSDTWLNNVRAARAKGQKLVPPHNKATEYRYNTLDQIVEAQTPDAGVTRFWYDRLGRLTATQNARQAPLRKYIYNVYDALSRIIETGELRSVNPLTYYSFFTPASFQQWLSSGGQTRVEVRRNSYDIAYAPLSQLVLSARNLRNRTAWSALYANITDLTSGNYSAATFYSYDIHGNVDTLLQDYKKSGMADAGNRFKKIVYRYDLIGGQTKEVAYQPSQPDAFYHRYSYDAENRLTNVETSHDYTYWENDAYYQYYKHGTLARMVLGQQQVQGLDYAYTLQGWLKGVNASVAAPATDMGGDGIAGSQVAKDAVGFALYYYGNRDYNIISTTKRPFASVDATGIKPLFTGNVAASSQHIPALGESLLSIYNYDQLNRLKTAKYVRGLNTSTNVWTPVTLQDFKENISYDEDGNILTYSRNGSNTFTGKPLAMDFLTYNYKPGKNRLDFVADTVNSVNYSNDIDNQLTGNFVYDSTGNLIGDNVSGITNITWTIYGKIATITKADGTQIAYTYDVGGNRISKTMNGIQTWYVRDATGSVLSVYTKGDNSVNAGDLTRTESHLYGTGRLGINTLPADVQHVVGQDSTRLSGLGNGIFSGYVRGRKAFELSNQLGNVLAVVTDKKRGVSTDSTTISYFEPDIVSAQEYHPFGMAMHGRSLNSNKYRYGFNGKENDNEVKGDGNQQDYGMRIYDPRLGRFLSADPIAKEYPALTPYQFASNTPIQAIDRDGLEATFSQKKNVHYVELKNVDVSFVSRKSRESFIEAALAKDGKATQLTINTQMYSPENAIVYVFRYLQLYSGLEGRQPAEYFKAQGYNIDNGKIVSGKSSEKTFYFAQSAPGENWTAGQGDPPANSYKAFGGATPVFVDGLKYGEKNIYRKGAPDGLPVTGDPGPDNRQFLLQRSNGVYPGQNPADEGKTVLGYNNKTNQWIIVSQQDKVEGMTLDDIRNDLIKRGYTTILAFDGSSSSTLVKDKEVMTAPHRAKNYTMPTGVTFTVPDK